MIASGLRPVHLISPLTWAVSEGYVNLGQVVLARRGHLRLEDALCGECREGLAPVAVLALQLLGVEGSVLMLGDLVGSDDEAVARAKAAASARARCEQAQHLDSPGDYTGHRSVYAPAAAR